MKKGVRLPSQVAKVQVALETCKTRILRSKPHLPAPCCAHMTIRSTLTPLLLLAPSLTTLTSAQCASSERDPHLHFAHGGRADFRGRDGKLYTLLSAPGLTVNARTEDAVYRLHTPRHNLVINGSFFTEVHLVAIARPETAAKVAGSGMGFGGRWSTEKRLLASYWASELNDANWGWRVVNGSCSGRPFKLGKGGYRKCDRLEVEVDMSSAVFRLGDWTVTVRGNRVYDRIAGPRHRVDIHYAARGAAVAGLPHGIIGQSFASSTPRSGRVDLYPSSGNFTTSAMAEGAIDGDASQYEVGLPHETRFAYSRFDAAFLPLDDSSSSAVTLEASSAERTPQDEAQMRRLDEDTPCPPPPCPPSQKVGDKIAMFQTPLYVDVAAKLEPWPVCDHGAGGVGRSDCVDHAHGEVECLTHFPPPSPVHTINAKPAMRDGALLATDVYFLPGYEPPIHSSIETVATMLVACPYNTRGDFADNLITLLPTLDTIVSDATSGILHMNMATLLQQSRGLYTSGPPAEPCEPNCFDSFKHSKNDSADTAAWVVSQDWSNGVLLWQGASAMGMLAALAAGGHEATPRLHGSRIPTRAMWLSITTNDIREALYRQGALMSGIIDAILYPDFIPVNQISLAELAQHEGDGPDPWWDDVRFDDWRSVNFPSVVQTAWYDMFLKGGLRIANHYHEDSRCGAFGSPCSVRRRRLKDIGSPRRLSALLKQPIRRRPRPRGTLRCPRRRRTVSRERNGAGADHELRIRPSRSAALLLPTRYQRHPRSRHQRGLAPARSAVAQTQVNRLAHLK